MSEEPTRHRILVVDDEEVMRESLQYTLDIEGFTVITAASGREALKKLQEEDVEILLADLKMPGMDGIELVRRVKRDHPKLPIILMTAFGTVSSAVEAMRDGADDYLPKPFETDLLLVTIERCLRQSAADAELALLRRELRERYGMGNLIGRSTSMQRVYETISRIAATNATVLVQGESGTGKELVARAIHFNSQRKKAPFLSINCGGLTETLLQSELFGHEKGAFTGADFQKKGLFEEAHGGTLFLDEIGETTPHFQVTLLRVLQEGAIKRVGSARTINVDVRIIAASNRDLEKEVEAAQFRKDLFYRLNVIPIVVPPLRQRRDDIPLLATHFLTHFAKLHGRLEMKLTAETVDKLVGYDWPGNVRELENRMERAVLLTQGSSITVDDIPLGIDDEEEDTFDMEPFGEAKNHVVDRFERRYLTKILSITRGNVSRAARIAKKERSAFQKLMRKHGIRSESFRAPGAPAFPSDDAAEK